MYNTIGDKTCINSLCSPQMLNTVVLGMEILLIKNAENKF